MQAFKTIAILGACQVAQADDHLDIENLINKSIDKVKGKLNDRKDN